MLKKYILLFIIFVNGNCFANGNRNDSSKILGAGRKSKANFVSFQPVGDNVALGLDFLVPFLQVPILREVDVYGNEPALININSAALISTGVLAASSLIVSYLIKTFVIFGREEGKTSSKNRRSDNDFENEFWSVLNNFKLVYKNDSGIKVDTSLSRLFYTIDETFQSNDIDLSACIQKAICKRIQSSSSRVVEGTSTGVDKIIDGVTSITWLKHMLRYTSFKDAIEARDISEPHTYCNDKYPKCKWSKPEDNLADIMRTYLKFT